MRTVTILRGVSGSGKSTYTAKNFSTATVCSADLFFLKDGVYQFDATKLGNAHSWCFRQFEAALQRGDDSVVVDNTNTKLWEFKNYVQAAAKYGYEVKVVRLTVDVAVAAARNLHGVPVETVQRMQDRFQDFPGEEIVNTGVTGV